MEFEKASDRSEIPPDFSFITEKGGLARWNSVDRKSFAEWPYKTLRNRDIGSWRYSIKNAWLMGFLKLWSRCLSGVQGISIEN